ncbi:MAG TPA: hypothetical protein VIN10_09465 [Bacteroidales bacterium]
MKSDFEKRIRENKGYFDSSQPDDGHLERFIAKLDNKAKKERKSHFMLMLSKAAAVFLLLLAVSFVAYNLFISKDMAANNSEITHIQLPEELNEVLAYYDAASLTLLDSIAQYAADTVEGKRIKNMIEDQFAALDANMAAIEKEYQKNPENQALSAALINNKRKKVEVAEQVARQMDLSNKGFF